MQSLQDILNQAGKRPQIIADTVTILEQEVAKKKGVSGFAIKQGFGVVRKIQSGRLLEKAINKMLPDFVAAIEPYYQTYLADGLNGSLPFANFLSQQDTTVANSLLGVTDRVRNGVDNRILVKTYDGLRKSALKHVVEAVPAVGQLIQTHAIT